MRLDRVGDVAVPPAVVVQRRVAAVVARAVALFFVWGVVFFVGGVVRER